MIKKWLADEIFKKELENVDKYLRKKIKEQEEEIKNLKLRLLQLINQGENKWK